MNTESEHFLFIGGNDDAKKKRANRNIWALSIGMLLMNVSSSLVYICMPFFFKYCCNLKSGLAGAIEGIVEGFSLLIRTFAGSLSDIARKRRPFIITGYLFTFLARAFIAASSSIDSVLLVISSRFLDKLGNGIQASPREALISDSVSSDIIGKAYGFNKAFGLIGSVAGSLLALLIFVWLDKVNFTILFFTASCLSLFAILIAVVFVKDVDIEEKSSKRQKQNLSKNSSIKIKHAVAKLREFSFEYWKVVCVASLFKLGYFSGTYMMLLFSDSKIGSFFFLDFARKPHIAGPIVMLIQNVMSAAFSLPFGNFSDRQDRRASVAIGLSCMLASLLCFGLFASSSIFVCIGVALYGIQMGMQGALLALLSDTMPKELSGTGFGVFYTFTGISVILTNWAIMGPIWDSYSPSAAFLTVCMPIALSLIVLSFVKANPTKNR
ncbi:MFS transporter [Candidatus Hydrogenosomobacter endosymbioticus]|uniref:MFS transporter n=1 Tax=Candidatus Hydrogenosomobacter endosymbioticus TaxID=2558174 RepID=UPI001F4065A8|nr:MFS transporter [Candidatus Hydrogenosomobacter endosymbioticus]